MPIIYPHGSAKVKTLFAEDRNEALKRARSLFQLVVTTKEASDIIMLGMGAFTPLDGFMGFEDWKSVCTDYQLTSQKGVFWPIPITLSVPNDTVIPLHSAISLVCPTTKQILAILHVESIYRVDKSMECQEVYKTTDPAHPGVKKIMQQGDCNVSGRLEVLSESYYPDTFSSVYLRPKETRILFERQGWKTVAALQLRNPMHNSHMYLGWIALEVCDGLFIHQIVGKLKDDDIPAEVRVQAVDAVVKGYMNQSRIIQGGYPLEMRYAGPREALLHALFRQNFGCTHMIIGRDHAGVGKYYGPFDAQNIFDQIPEGALTIKPLKLDWTFYCNKCQSMASLKTCPHDEKERILLSGTALRKMLQENSNVPPQFSKPEVLEILREYYKTKIA